LIMKNMPLATQIWLVFGFALILPFLLASLVPLFLPALFTPVYFKDIEEVQQTVLEKIEKGDLSLDQLPQLEDRFQLPNREYVEHVVVYSDNTVISSAALDRSIIAEIIQNTHNQEEDRRRYEVLLGDTRYYYALSRIEQPEVPVHIASLMVDIYIDEMVLGLFSRFVMIIAFILLLCWLPSILLARYLSKPLVRLGQHVQQIAGFNWAQPIRVDRQDEIGKLAASIERMRKILVQQDEAQQSFLQNVSHELKTPVMVIRSYAQSIIDGIYPHGDLANTAKIIEEESQRLEKRIQNLLYLTKIDYLSAHEPITTEVKLDQVIEDVIKRFKWRRGEVEWFVELSPLSVPGTPEQWTVVFENLLDNQLRYAASRVEISLQRQKSDGRDSALVRLWNDGPSLSEADLERLFYKFQRGPGGEFGLGLAIVQRLVGAYGGKVSLVNEKGGAAYYLMLPTRI